MCGRFSLITPIEELKRRFRAEPPAGVIRPRYNTAPGNDLLVIPGESPHQMQWYRWGLIPHWTKDPAPGNRLINARAETVAQKPSFRDAYRNHRCLVLADGFYEWDTTSKPHVPYRITLKNNEPFAFAGIASHWKDNNGKSIYSFSIITTAANNTIEAIHDRMPVILCPEDEHKWLNAGLEEKHIGTLLKPYADEELVMYPISTLINNPRNDVPEVLLQKVV